jgi:hypothetical protein
MYVDPLKCKQVTGIPKNVSRYMYKYINTFLAILGDNFAAED